jgi:ElaB/YqjD/DUF883 family membrane-anchored ribosome-binding protein
MHTQPNISEVDVKARSGTSVPPPMAAPAGSRSALSGEFHDLIEDIEDFVKNTTALTGQDLARAKAKLNERVAAARVRVDELGGEIADRARTAARTTDSYVHDHPWQAIGIGAAIGLLVGVVISRSR